MVHHKTSPTVEDYLQAIHNMQSDGRTVITARLAERVQAAPPTVWATIQRMVRDGLVRLNERKEIILTEAGLAAAESVVRRHRLAERFLTDVLGLGWAEAHEEAHLLEHSMSPKIEARMVEVLGRPGTCPHGNPIPGMGYELPKDLVTLDTIEEGEAVVEVVTEEAELDLRLLHFLDVNGLRPGVRIRISEYAPFNQTTTVQVGERTVTLGLASARKILARRVPAAAGAS